MRSKIPISAAVGWLPPSAWVLPLACPLSRTTACVAPPSSGSTRRCNRPKQIQYFVSVSGILFVLSLARWLQARNSLASRCLRGVGKTGCRPVLRTSHCHGQYVWGMTCHRPPRPREDIYHFQATPPLAYKRLLLVYKNIFSWNSHLLQHATKKLTPKRTSLFPGCTWQVVYDRARSERRIQRVLELRLTGNWVRPGHVLGVFEPATNVGDCLGSGYTSC